MLLRNHTPYRKIEKNKLNEFQIAEHPKLNFLARYKKQITIALASAIAGSYIIREIFNPYEHSKDSMKNNTIESQVISKVFLGEIKNAEVDVISIKKNPSGHEPIITTLKTTSNLGNSEPPNLFTCDSGTISIILSDQTDTNQLERMYEIFTANRDCKFRIFDNAKDYFEYHNPKNLANKSLVSIDDYLYLIDHIDRLNNYNINELIKFSNNIVVLPTQTREIAKLLNEYCLKQSLHGAV